MQASSWSRRLPILLRLCVVSALVAAGGWAFTEGVLTIDDASATESLRTTISEPLRRWVQVAGTVLCVGSVAALSWSPSVRLGTLGATAALLISAALAGYVWFDIEAVAPGAVLAARDLAVEDCATCESSLEAGFGILVAVFASALAAAGSAIMGLVADQ
jgi:hypothetical protein